MSFAFEKLHVYQKSVDFADRFCGRTEQCDGQQTVEIAEEQKVVESRIIPHL